jgi:hypothetical protein
VQGSGGLHAGCTKVMLGGGADSVLKIFIWCFDDRMHFVSKMFGWQKWRAINAIMKRVAKL